MRQKSQQFLSTFLLTGIIFTFRPRRGPHFFQFTIDFSLPRGYNIPRNMICGRSSMVEHQLPKLNTRVRFPSPAPASAQSPLDSVSGGRLRLLPKTASVPLRLLSRSRPLCWVAILFFLPSPAGDCWGACGHDAPFCESKMGHLYVARGRAVNYLPAVPKYSKRAVSTAAACFLAGGSKTPTLPGSARRYHARMAAGRRTRARPA